MAKNICPRHVSFVSEAFPERSNVPKGTCYPSQSPFPRTSPKPVFAKKGSEGRTSFHDLREANDTQLPRQRRQKIAVCATTIRGNSSVRRQDGIVEDGIRRGCPPSCGSCSDNGQPCPRTPGRSVAKRFACFLAATQNNREVSARRDRERPVRHVDTQKLGYCSSTPRRS